MLRNRLMPDGRPGNIRFLQLATWRANMDPLAAFRRKNRMEETLDYRLIVKAVTFWNAPIEPSTAEIYSFMRIVVAS